MDVVQDISDWVVVMAEGRIIAEGPPASISENSQVVDAYLGSSHGSELDFDSVEAIGGDDGAESDSAGSDSAGSDSAESDGEAG